MNIKSLLKATGLVASEIKQRLSNKQIKLNGEVFDHNMEFDVEEVPIDLGDFLFENHDFIFGCSLIHLFPGRTQEIFGITPDELDFYKDHTKTQEWFMWFNNFICITIGKKQHFVFKK